MSTDSESGALVWRRFRMFYHPVPDPLEHQLRRPINVASASNRAQRAKPIELLERRIMMSGGCPSVEAISSEPVCQIYRQ
jgi:hypothetical protein